MTEGVVKVRGRRKMLGIKPELRAEEDGDELTKLIVSRLRVSI